MDGSIRIKGGRKLKGVVSPIPNKNSLMAALPAALLAHGGVVYHDVPKTSDVEKLLEIHRELGAVVKDLGDGKMLVNCDKVKKWQVSKKIAGTFRGSFLFAGPLLARFGRAQVPVPGGCLLGERSMAAHVDSFSRVGVGCRIEDGMYHFSAPEKVAGNYRVWQLEASVTGTENLALYAAGIGSRVEIIDAAGEPHVADLLYLLKNMGAKIEGIGSNRLVIEGRQSLGQGEFCAGPDFIDIAGYMVAAAITDGQITIKGANIPNIVDGLIVNMELFGVKVKRDGDDLVVTRDEKGLRINLEGGFPMAGTNLPKLKPQPWPGFPVDALPVMVTLAAKSKGRLLIHNWMYESGLDFVRELNGIGADILTLDPHRILIHDRVVEFSGGEVSPPEVIQAMKAVFLAALADPVETTIHGVDILRRRYPNIIEMYRKLGAQIESLG